MQETGDGSGLGAPNRHGGDVLAVLRARGVDVPDEARRRIQSQADPATLERWLERAVVAGTIEDVVDDPS